MLSKISFVAVAIFLGLLLVAVNCKFEDVHSFVEGAISGSDVVIFSKSYCPYCARVKKLFDGIGQVYSAHELDREEKGGLVQQYLLEKTGQRTVPSVFINGKHIGGADATDVLHQKGELKTLLAQAKRRQDL